MHSEEVSGDELTHLDEDVANANCMNCGGFRLSVQRCYDRSATKMPHVHPCPRLQLCLQPCAPPRHHHICIASTFATITPLCKAWWIISSSCNWCKLLPHQDVSVHCWRLLLNTWKMMLCHSYTVGNPCTVVCARGTLKDLELSAKRKEKSLKWEKDHQPWPTIHHICCSVMA